MLKLGRYRSSRRMKSESREHARSRRETTRDRGVERRKRRGESLARIVERGAGERAFRYAPKAAAAARHKMPVIVALVAVLLRLLHGLVIVLLLTDGSGLDGCDRGRLLATRVHSVARSAGGTSPKARSGRINKLGTPDEEVLSHTPIHYRFLTLSDSLADPRLAQKKKRRGQITILRDAGRKHVAANMREFP